MDHDYIHELFAAFGAVSLRHMFGGAGLYADGVMFGLVFDGQIFLKADEATAPVFEREGCAPFEYGTKTGKRAVMSFWRLPDRLYDDPDELALWAKRALAAARRKSAVKPKAPGKGSRKKRL